MKTRFLVPCLMALALAPRAAAEWRPGKYMTEAMTKIIVVGSALEQRSNFGWNSDGLCFMGAFLQPKAAVAFNINLEAGAQYAFVGAGDNTADDLDLEILDGSTVLTKDTDADSTPLVEFRPRATKMYTMRLKLYKASGGSFAGVAILRRGGYRVPVANLANAYVKNLALSVKADSLAGARYHDHDNQWALYAQVLRQGEELGISNMTFEPRRHLILAAGDENASDLDLAVKSGSRVIVEDTDADATPIAEFSPSGGGYGFAVKNVQARGAALVIASVVDRN